MKYQRRVFPFRVVRNRAKGLLAVWRERALTVGPFYFLVCRQVGGSKMGVIRYMGETDFAKGEWCGVELDEPLGKNDGAVAGTR